MLKIDDLLGNIGSMLTCFFVGGKDYEFELIGWITGGEEGSSKRKVTINEPPKNGRCTADPRKGPPLEPIFTLNCTGFTDDETPLHYEFLYSKGEGLKKDTLGRGLEALRSRVTFPSGLEENKYELTLYAKVSDNLGASRIFEFSSTIQVSSRMEIFFISFTYIFICITSGIISLATFPQTYMGTI